MLRFYNLNEMPFMHDEFSALFRTRFDSFTEVINTGVKIGDTHPAGIQVFLWYYVKLVGENEVLLKLPFIIMGILSIPLIYKIGKEWFNKNVGLLSAVFIATSQYTLTYSVIIRPYISGLFFALAMVYFWTAIYKSKGSIKNYLGYILFSILCAYNHHFSLLFAFIVGITGLFVFNKKSLFKYILAGLVILLLYLPHFSILMFQLNKGGLDGWLRKPSLLLPIDYIKYVLHFSVWSYLMVLAIFFTSIIVSWNKKWSIFYRISLIWFALPITIGMIYSIFVSPVIQYSMLIFSFPFLLFSIFGLFPQKISKRFTFCLIIGLLMVNTFTLINNRQHYRVLYQTRHLQFLKDIDSLPQKEQASILIANHVEINNYYQKKYNWSFTYINSLIGVSDKLELKKLQEIVKESNKPFFIYGGVSYADPETVQIIKEKYPFCILKKDYYAGNLYLFSKTSNKDTLSPYFNESNNFSKQFQKWNNVDLTYSKKGAILPAEKEWGPSFSLALPTVLRHRNDVIDISVEFESTEDQELLLVTQIKHKDSLISYAITSSALFIKNSNKNSIIYKTIELSGIPFPSLKGLTFSTYLWNQKQGDFILKNYSIQLRKGNPIQYSLYEPILNDYE